MRKKIFDPLGKILIIGCYIAMYSVVCEQLKTCLFACGINPFLKFISLLNRHIRIFQTHVHLCQWRQK